MYLRKIKLSKFKEYQPEIYGVTFCILLLNVWYLSGLAIENDVVPNGLDILIRFIIPLMSGFFGAYSAFKLKELQEAKQQLNLEVFSLQEAAFTLVRQMNAIESLRENLNEYKNSKNRTIELKAFQMFNYKSIRINIDNLTFLITKGHSNLLFQLSREQESFEITIDAIEIRSDFHISKFQPEFEKIQIDKNYKIEDLKRDIGMGLYGSLEVFTDNVYEAVERTFESQQSSLAALQLVAKELYPDSNFKEFIRKKTD